MRDVAADLARGQIHPKDSQITKVAFYNDNWYSVHNRRLFCLKFAGVEEVDRAPDDLPEVGDRPREAASSPGELLARCRRCALRTLVCMV